MKAPRPRYPRSSCVVPFCRHTSTLFRGEWICGDHWRMVDKALRQVRTRLIRRWKRSGRWQRYQPGGSIDRTLDGWWRRVKRQATERAAGVSA